MGQEKTIDGQREVEEKKIMEVLQHRSAWQRASIPVVIITIGLGLAMTPTEQLNLSLAFRTLLYLCVFGPLALIWAYMDRVERRIEAVVTLLQMRGILPKIEQ